MEPPLRLLSLDGGGIKGLSSLYILRHLLSAIQRQVEAQDSSKKMTSSPRPCDYFDMIAGTSTGGLIAVMLGVLRMDIQTCIDAYLKMAPKIFPVEGVVSGSKFGRLKNVLNGDPRFDPAPLELAIKDLVKEHLGSDATGNELMRSRSKGECRVFVCVASEKPYKNFRFRNYNSPKGAFEDVAIWEACRATSAAPTYFPPISIGNPPRTFVDGGMGYNNPIQALLEESTHIWPSRSLGCLVSIGTGMAGSQDVGRSLKPLMETLKSISIDTEKVAREVKEQMAHQYPSQGVYFRFNVQHGLQNVGLEEWKELGRVQTVTEDYLQENWQQIDSCASQILSPVNPVPLCSNPESRKSHSTIPFPQDDNFVGRDSILIQLDAILSAPINRRWAALYGLGGIGKSQIAIEYSYRVRSPQVSTFWVHASSEARFEQSYSDIAAKVGIAGNGDGNVDTLQAVSTWFANPKNGHWLLILDNADDATVLTSLQPRKLNSDNTPHQRMLDFVPQVQHGAVLITTRDRICGLDLVGPGSDPVYVDSMTSTESIQLVRTRLPSASDDEASELVEELENVPLAITQATAYIREIQQVSISLYLAKFRRSNEDQAALLNKNKIDFRRDAGVPNAVITSWELSLIQIRNMCPAAAHLLSLMSYFHRQGIPQSLLQEEDDELSFYENINPLLSFSLIRAEIGGQTFQMHKLVQTSMQHWLRCEGSDQLWTERAVERLAHRFPTWNSHDTDWAVREALMSHADEVLSRTVSSRESELNRAKLLACTAWYLIHTNGDARLGEQRSRLALEIQRAYLDGDSHDVLITLSILAMAMRHPSQFEKTSVLEESILEHRMKLHGPENEHTLIAMHNLANRYQSLGQYAKAADLLEITVEGERRLLGLRPSATLCSIKSLADVKLAQGKLQEAEELYATVLEKSTTSLGVIDDMTLQATRGLTELYLHLGKFSEAKELSISIIPTLEKTWGSNLWITLEANIVLAEIYYRQGSLDEAEKLCANCLQTSDEPHSKRDGIMMNARVLLGSIYQAQGKFSLALRLTEDLVETSLVVLGSLHSETLIFRYNLAYCYYELGDQVRAIDIMDDVLQKQKEVLSADHPDVIDSANSLQYWRRQAGDA